VGNSCVYVCKSVCVRVSVRQRVCVCVCVRACLHTRESDFSLALASCIDLDHAVGTWESCVVMHVHAQTLSRERGRVRKRERGGE